MDTFKARFLTSTIAFGLILGAVVGAALYYGLPQFYPNWYFGIVFFFLILESVLIYFVTTNALKASSKKMVNLYMMAKVIKMITSLFFVAIYALTVKENMKSFVLVFIVFYALYLFFETFLYSKIERKIKEKNLSN